MGRGLHWRLQFRSRDRNRIVPTYSLRASYPFQISIFGLWNAYTRTAEHPRSKNPKLEMFQKSETVKIPGSPASKPNGDSSISEEGGGNPGRVGWGGDGYKEGASTLHERRGSNGHLSM